jgi:hypothetical protein
MLTVSPASVPVRESAPVWTDALPAVAVPLSSTVPLLVSVPALSSPATVEPSLSAALVLKSVPGPAVRVPPLEI